MQSKKIIIHTGTHKTGSSSIQKSFKNFDNGNIRYAFFNEENHSIPIYSCFSFNYFNYHIHKKNGLNIDQINFCNNEWLKIFANELSLPHPTLIISGEDIGLLKYNELINLKFLIEKYDRKPLIYMYIRPPNSLASSLLQQNIAGGISKVYKNPQQFYRQRIEPLATVFGVENLKIRDYTKLNSGCVIKDFSSWLGIENNPKKTIVNKSLPLDTVKALFLFNCFGTRVESPKSHSLARSKLIELLNSLSVSESFKLPEKNSLNFFSNKDILWIKTFLKENNYQIGEDWNYESFGSKNFYDCYGKFVDYSIASFLLQDTPELRDRLIFWLKEKNVFISDKINMISLLNSAYCFIYNHLLF